MNLNTSAVRKVLPLLAPRWRVNQIFFGLWLLPLGILVYRSGWFPKWLGVWLVFGCFGQLVELAAIYLTPNFDESNVMAILLPGGISEIVFALWATIRGASAPGAGRVPPAERVPASGWIPVAD